LTALANAAALGLGIEDALVENLQLPPLGSFDPAFLVDSLPGGR
jgi:hypothetical protein